MTARNLTARELKQRQRAALRSGSHSDTKVRPAATRLYARLRRRLVRAEGPTTPVTRLRLRMLATTLARIEMAETYLAQQSDELFADRQAAAVHALHDRLDRWVNTALAIIDKLPESSAEHLGLSALGARRR